MAILDRYKPTATIRHPSWRIYRALEEIKASNAVSEHIKDELSLELFGLKTDAKVYYPYRNLDDVTLELVAALTHADYEDTDFFMDQCLSLFLDVKARQLLECSLMDDMMPADIGRDLGMPTSVVQSYKTIFFDISVWRNDADKIYYIRRGTVGDDSTYKNMALDKGIDYMKVRKFNMPAKIHLEKSLGTVFGKAYQKTIDFMDSDAGEDQKVAQDWTKQLVNLYRELKSASRAEGGIRELTIALQTNPAPSKSMDDLDDDDL